MASPVYSKLLFESTSSPANGTTVSPTVPTGYVWVVRTITAENTASWESFVLGIGFTTTLGQTYLASAFYPYVGAGVSYQWDMHHVLNAGESVSVFTSELHWVYRLSGYQLTLP